MDKLDEIKNLMRTLSEFIAQSEETVRSGTMVDLSGLDSEVGALCDKTVALPPAEAAEVQPLMADLISRLEDLGRTLKDFQDSLSPNQKTHGSD